jgi:fatty acid desaturase
MDRPKLEPEVLRELYRARPVRHYFRLALFIGLYAVSGYGAYRVATEFSYVAAAPLYVLAAASLHGVSLFTHEAVHGTLSRNRAWNHALGAACALPVLQNFAAYKVLHLRHHDHLGEPGDPDHYDNYTRWTWLVFAMHWGRLIAGYPVYVTAIPILGFRHGTGRERFWILVEVAALAAVVVGVLLSPISLALLLHAWLIPMLVINTLVNIRGMSQHTMLDDQSDEIRGTRSILTNRVTAFFMCNENYHLEHHLHPGVPWYNLPRLHRELRPQLVARGAPFIGSYFAFVWAFITGSLRRSPLGRTGAR